MNVAAKRQRLLTALGDVCNGQVSEQEGAWLEDLLQTDVEAQRTYIDYLSMHSMLHSECASLHLGNTDSAADDPSAGYELAESGIDELHTETVLRSLDAHSAASPSPTLLASEHARPASAISIQLPLRWAMAASLLLIALFSSFVTYFTVQSFRSPADLATSEHHDDLMLAQITGTQNCLWKNSTGPIGYGSNLIAGQRLELLDGIAEITFKDGATVLVESPASFIVNAPHEVDLRMGRMAAVVPQDARGFHVHTRSLDVFDVGAEFGLVAQESGTAELHVFNGLVNAVILDPTGKRHSRLELNASQAARVNPVATTITEFPANKASFVRSMIPNSGPQNGLFAYEGFDYPEGPLAAQNGGFGWAGPWFDLEADEDAEPHSNGVASGSVAVEAIVPVGNHASQTAHKNRIRRSLGTSVGAVFDAAGLVENQDGVRLIGRDGKHVYLSFIQRISKVNDGFYGLELHRGDGNANRVLCIGNGADGAGYGATSNVNVYGAKNYPSLGKENTEPNFYVVKISYGAANRDVAEIYRNPESLRDESVCQADAVMKGNFAFDRISFGNFDGQKVHDIDEVRVGTHFLAVTGRWGGDRVRRNIPTFTFQHQNGEPLYNWKSESRFLLATAPLVFQ